MTTSNEI